MTQFETVDTGTKQKFDTGAQRNSAKGKGHYADYSPLAMKRVAALLERGADIYGSMNYAKGMPMLRTVESMLRHAYQYLEGDRSEDHLAAVSFNAMVLMHTEEGIERGILPQSLKDLPDYYRPAIYANPQPKAYTADEIRDWLRGDSDTAVDGSVVGTSPIERIYVAGPYSDSTDRGVAFNVIRAAKYTDAIMRLGHDAHCPHTATHQVDEMGQRQLGYERWMRLDFGLIERWATAVFVIANSPGTNREVEHAKQLGLKIYYKLSDIPDISKG